MGLKNHKVKHLHSINGRKKTDELALVNHEKTQEELLRETIQKVEGHEEIINEILSQLKRNQSSPSSSFSPLNILDKLDLDMEKMMSLASFIYGIYMDNKKKAD